MADPAPPRRTFRRRQRLQHAREFQAVYQGKVRKARGGIVVFGIPPASDNPQPCSRLGLSIGRAVGTAVARNRLKRLVREAFRLDHDSWPGPYDLVVSIRSAGGKEGAMRGERVPPSPPTPPHPTLNRPLTLAQIRDTLDTLVREIDREWRRRARRKADEAQP